HLQDAQELQAFKTVLLHCMVILALPVISFFISKIFIFDGLLGFPDIASNVYASAVSILVLHIGLGSFIYRAYFDNQARKQTKRE
ncbi:Vacuolar ATPase assembly integral membrane protein VMA21, partial [Eufriesea mexicana]